MRPVSYTHLAAFRGTVGKECGLAGGSGGHEAAAGCALLDKPCAAARPAPCCAGAGKEAVHQRTIKMCIRDSRDVKSFGEEVCEYGFYNQGAMRSTNSS